MTEYTETVHEQAAKELFTKGYNCAQSVFCSFKDELQMDEKTARALSSSFGGGIGKMRMICGALTGALMVLGFYYGDYDPLSPDEKSEHYARVREIAHRFEEEAGSMICRELLENNQVDVSKSENPEERTEEYYKKRTSCLQCVGLGARLVDIYLLEHPLQK